MPNVSTTNKELRREELKKAMSNMIPHANGPALMSDKINRIVYLRGLKHLNVIDKIALLLSDGAVYSGWDINSATKSWSWNQRKNADLPRYGFFCKTLPQNPTDEAAEYHYQADVENPDDARDMAYRYCNTIFDFIDGKIIRHENTMVPNLKHPDVKISTKQMNTIHMIRKHAGWDRETYIETLKAWGKPDAESAKDLSKAQAKKYIEKAAKEVPGVFSKPVENIKLVCNCGADILDGTIEYFNNDGDDGPYATISCCCLNDHEIDLSIWGHCENLQEAKKILKENWDEVKIS